MSNQVMPRVNGQTFRCTATDLLGRPNCGANVFTALEIDAAKGETKYECNGCGARYIGTHATGDVGAEEKR